VSPKTPQGRGGVAHLLSTLTPLLLVLACTPTPPAPAHKARGQTSPGPVGAKATSAEGQTSVPMLELVESVPLETTWDTPAREAASVWPELFDGATRTIELAQFYFAHKPGQALDPTLSALERAARRGVKVRILAEKSMAAESADTLGDLGRLPNVEWAWFDISQLTGGIIHAKYMVVDDSTVFVGSQNFDWRALEHIHELGVLIRDRSVAAAFLRVFDTDWEAMTTGRWTHDEILPDRDADGLPDGTDPRPKEALCSTMPDSGENKVCPLFAPSELLPAGLRRSLPALLGLIDSAKASLDIQLMTYGVVQKEGAKWTTIDDSLRRAAGRGVRIRMNISDWSLSEHRIGALKGLQQVKGVEVRINSIPDFSGGYIPYSRVDHSKYMVVDGRIGWIGTSNWDKSYFTTLRSAEVCFNDRNVVDQLAAIFDKGWHGPYATPLVPDREYEPRKHD
jgi:phosphatidylserine/phosphatidylglycerophosphate/cardiolipin synthase-like enzyme